MGLRIPSVLTELGGVGKTQLAANHAHHLWKHQQLDVLAWITASSRRETQAAYAGLAKRVLDLHAIDSGLAVDRRSG